jgi:diguanylate cyclase (GGDEF)-like protein
MGLSPFDSLTTDHCWQPMKPAEPAKILLLAQSPEKTGLWTDMLRATSACLWAGQSAAPDHQRPEVVVTDANPVVEGDCAVVRIGAGDPADVNLPDPPSPRELQLACRLLAEIVRLRRQQRATAEAQHRLHAQAFTDPLTGLANRRAWDQALAERFALVDDSRSLCLAIFDLDLFKQVNDCHGHAAGDEVLKTVATAICQTLRQEDFVARLGGDEFGLLIWVAEPGIAQAVVERVRSILPQRLAEAVVRRVTSSAGVAVATAADAFATGPDRLFARADEALRRAKQEGRDRTVCASD